MNDQEEGRHEDEGKADEEKHILEEWTQQKLALTQITKAMGELAKKLGLSTRRSSYFLNRVSLRLFTCSLEVVAGFHCCK